MTEPLPWKRGDTTPWPPMTARDLNGPVDLSDADEVRFLMRKQRGFTPIISRPLEEVEETDLTVGRWQFHPSESEVDLVGSYYFELRVTWGDGTVVTFPQSGYDRVYFTETLAEAPAS